jgi:STE24 endopeptidase
MATFSLVFLAALVLATAAKVWLAMRHLGHINRHRDAVPAEFAQEISLDAHRKAADYSSAKTRFALASAAFDCAVVLALTFGGGMQLLQDVAAGWLAPGVARGVTLIVLFALAMMVVELPFGIYSTFGIEARFGFNKITPKLFVIDTLKQLVVGGLLFIPITALVLWLMEKSGALWWVYAWLALVAFSLFVQLIVPIWIQPWFNKFTPLNDAKLKERIDKLVRVCGFKIQGLMVMDGSTRSSHGNAYFVGFGKTKRIVFFDTLIERLSHSEIEAVLAHELGHYKLHHIIKRLIFSFLVSLVSLWVLSVIIDQSWFYNGLNVQTLSAAMGLILFFAFVVPQFTFILHPLSSFYSRKHEFEADRYAAQHASAADLVSALVKLYKDNAATLTPDPLHSMFYDSHPPATLRIARLQSTPGV